LREPVHEWASAALAREVAAAVAQTDGVARLTPGRGVEAATYYPGGKTQGVVVTGEGSVVISALPVVKVVERVQRAVGDVLARYGEPRRVGVVVEDLVLERLPEQAAGAERSGIYGQAALE